MAWLWQVSKKTPALDLQAFSTSRGFPSLSELLEADAVNMLQKKLAKSESEKQALQAKLDAVVPIMQHGPPTVMPLSIAASGVPVVPSAVVPSITVGQPCPHRPDCHNTRVSGEHAGKFTTEYTRSTFKFDATAGNVHAGRHCLKHLLPGTLHCAACHHNHEACVSACV